MDLDTLAEDLRRATVAVMSAGNVVGAGVIWAPARAPGSVDEGNRKFPGGAD